MNYAFYAVTVYLVIGLSFAIWMAIQLLDAMRWYDLRLWVLFVLMLAFWPGALMVGLLLTYNDRGWL